MKTELRYVNNYRDRHGKQRSYYRRNGLGQRIEGEPGSAEWLANYTRIHESFEQPASRVPDHDTLAFAIQEYLQSDRYRRLAPSSQRVYRKSLDDLRRALGKRKLRDFTRGSINKIRDTIAARSPSMAVLTVKTLNVVFECAKDYDMIERNPARGVIKPAAMKVVPHRPWTDDEIAMVLDQGDPFVRRAVMVLLYTGLRACDAVVLTRASIKDGIIRLVTQKTHTKVSIPLHGDLKDELRRSLPVESIYLVPGRRGQEMTVPSTSSAIKRQFIKLGHDDRPPMHGLRKNAVAALIEAGCEPREIQAITGQSLDMIEHYGQDYNRDMLAVAAIHKLERKR